MKTRPSFECHACKGTFGKVVDLEGDPILLLECPYCGATCKVDLSPHKHRVVSVLRGGAEGVSGERYELPGRIPTVAAEEPGEAG